MKNTKGSSLSGQNANKQVVVYARVSSEEQTKGNYPSCESQVEELVAYCKARGWTIRQIIKDEGYSAGSLKRPGISEIRSLIEAKQITTVTCTWYDRLTRSRDFYVLDKEFKQHGVQFVTLHDATDTQTASGRFMESMLVAAKTYEREQTSEKIRSKLLMRAEKGMWNGGLAPFGFLSQNSGTVLIPDPEKRAVIQRLFQIYVETASDFKVRDWLKAHHISSPGGQPVWQVSTIRKLLINRRYIAQIELNRDNKDVEDVPESRAYRVVTAPHDPVVSIELFELAQQTRAEKAGAQPNRKGRPRSYSQTQCQRVYPLMVCAHCGHAMAPWYVCHKAGIDKSGKKRKNDCYIYYYLCAGQQKNWKGSDHKNCISARKAEDWVLDRLFSTIASPAVLASALEAASNHAKQDLAPVYEIYQHTNENLRQMEMDIAKLVQTASTGQAVGALWEMLNERAFRLKFEREQLLIEQRRLKEKLAPIEREIDEQTLLERLRDLEVLRKTAQPEEIKRLIRLLVRRLEWAPQGDSQTKQNHKVQFFVLPKYKDTTNGQSRDNKKPAGSQNQQAGVSYYDELRWI